MEQSSFKDRFSLGFLSPSEAPPNASPNSFNTPTSSSFAGGSLPLGLDAVLNSVGTQILSIMRANPGQPISLLNLASASSMRLEAVLPIVQYLAGKGLIQRVVEDPSGNDLYQLTRAGLNPEAVFLG
jgi:hypothetical protein